MSSDPSLPAPDGPPAGDEGWDLVPGDGRAIEEAFRWLDAVSRRVQQLAGAMESYRASGRLSPTARAQATYHVRVAALSLGEVLEREQSLRVLGEDPRACIRVAIEEQMAVCWLLAEQAEQGTITLAAAARLAAAFQFGRREFRRLEELLVLACVCRGLTPPGVEPAPSACPDPPPLPGDGLMERVASLLGDSSSVEIIKVVNQRNRPAEERMQEILRLDSRFAGRSSVQWADMLDVKPSAVRGYKTWKGLQKAKKSPE